MKFKPVDVSLDVEGNVEVTPIEINNDEEINQESQNEQQHQEEINSDEESQQEEISSREVEQIEPEEIKIDDSSVLEYLRSEYGKEFNSLEELFTSKNEVSDNSIEDEAIKKFLEYKKSTGRGMEDFVKLNKDWSTVSDEDIVREFIKSKKPHLNSSEIDFEIESMFSFDEELDSDKEVMRKKIAKKDYTYEARKFFTEMKDKYSASLESRVSESLPKDVEDLVNWKQEYDSQVASQQELAKQQRDLFLEKTDELFNEKFEGFEFKVSEDKVQVFKPSDVEKVKKDNLNVQNLLSKFLDEKGYIKDPVGYHKAIAIASNPDEFARFFYEQGKSDMATDVSKESSNSNMEVRRTHGTTTGEKPKVRAISNDNSRKGRIRLKNY